MPHTNLLLLIPRPETILMAGLLIPLRGIMHTLMLKTRVSPSH